MPAKLIAKKSADPATAAGSAPDGAAWNLSKVTPPTLNRVHSTRRLFARLDAAAERRIVWIHGPPGAGKTTLAASYLAEAGIDPLWYRLDEGDADPATLFFYLAAAWRGRKAGMTLPLLTPEFRSALPLFARRFFRGLFTCPKVSVVVFDDYHEVPAGAPLHQCLANGLEEVPKGCRVIVVSRTPPPAVLARLRLNGLVDVVEPDVLRLSLDEAEGLARQRGVIATAAKIEGLVRQTQGWTAGLILMLEAGTEPVPVPTNDAPVPEVLFDYFAGEILGRMDSDAQRLLCMLALMPTMTAASAARATGTTEVGALLEDLRKRNYFTTKDLSAEPRYRFHPLFRDFLLDGLTNRLSLQERRDFQIRAAEVLEEDGQPAAAVALLAAAGSSDLLAALIKRRAAALIDEGRNDTLFVWLAKLPPSLIDSDGWLSYWRGFVRLYVDPIEALPFMRRAFALFGQADDVNGQFLAWGGQAEAVRVDAFGDVGRFDPLIDDLRELLARHPLIPPGDVMLRVAMGMATGLSRRRNDRTEIALWQNRARAAAKESPGPGRTALVGYMFALSDFHDAKYRTALEALDRLPDPLTLDHLPSVQVSGLIVHAVALMYLQRPGDCAAFVEEALRRMEAAGYVLWMHLLAGLAANDAYRRGDLAALGAWLRRMSSFADEAAPNRGTHYRCLMARYEIMNGDLAAALSHSDTAAAFAIETGWPLFETYARLTRAEVLLESSGFDEAEAELERLDDVLSRSATRQIGFGAALLKADLWFARDDAAGGATLLTEALSLGRRQGDRRVPLSSDRVTRLFVRALKSNIEPEFVRTFIRASGIRAPDPDDETWPRPLKIRTLGGLGIETNGEPLVFTRKTPKRLILLLKALVTYGGVDVPEEKLVDAIWPDEDGDAGQSALKVAIHRLRQLLGDPGLLVVKGGRVGLDPARCWLDLWSFERYLASRRPDETDAGYAERLERGLALYRGDFLADDEDLWWILERRERLRKRFTGKAPAVVG